MTEAQRAGSGNPVGSKAGSLDKRLNVLEEKVKQAESKAFEEYLEKQNPFVELRAKNEEKMIRELERLKVEFEKEKLKSSTLLSEMPRRREETAYSVMRTSYHLATLFLISGILIWSIFYELTETAGLAILFLIIGTFIFIFFGLERLIGAQDEELEQPTENLREAGSTAPEAKFKLVKPSAAVDAKDEGGRDSTQLSSSLASKSSRTTEVKAHTSKESKLKERTDVELSSTSEESGDEEEEIIPWKLVSAVDSLCKSKGITKHVLQQNPRNMKNIAILGNVSVLGSEEKEFKKRLRELEKEFEGYTLFLTKGSCEIHTKQLMWRNSLRVERFGIERDGTCELIVKALLPETEAEVFFAVAPAHMMFNRRRNRRLMVAANIQSLMAEVRRIPLKKVYHFRSGLAGIDAELDQVVEEGEALMVPTTHPPLISYRYTYEGEKVRRATEHQRDMLEPQEEAIPLEARFCLNDMVLLQFEGEKSEEIQHRLRAYRETRRECLVNIRTWNKLKRYNQPGDRVINIVVKNLTGRLVNNVYSIAYQRDEGIAHHLMFELDDGELVNGDSGSIVYKVRNDGMHYPLGMVIGKHINPFGDILYKALILSQALQDIEACNDLRSLTLYTVPSDEQVTGNRNESEEGSDESAD